MSGRCKDCGATICMCAEQAGVTILGADCKTCDDNCPYCRDTADTKHTLACPNCGSVMNKIENGLYCVECDHQTSPGCGCKLCSADPYAPSGHAEPLIPFTDKPRFTAEDGAIFDNGEFVFTVANTSIEAAHNAEARALELLNALDGEDR